jgi:hypothetical protein
MKNGARVLKRHPREPYAMIVQSSMKLFLIYLLPTFAILKIIRTGVMRMMAVVTKHLYPPADWLFLTCVTASSKGSKPAKIAQMPHQDLLQLGLLSPAQPSLQHLPQNRLLNLHQSQLLMRVEFVLTLKMAIQSFLEIHVSLSTVLFKFAAMALQVQPDKRLCVKTVIFVKKGQQSMATAAHKRIHLLVVLMVSNAVATSMEAISVLWLTLGRIAWRNVLMKKLKVTRCASIVRNA